MTVVVDGYLPEQDAYCARSQYECYEVDGMVFVESGYELAIGDFVDVTIKTAADYDCFGEVAAYEDTDEPGE